MDEALRPARDDGSTAAVVAAGRRRLATRRPVLVASTTAGEKAFCDTKVTTRGTIRVNTQGYQAMRVTVIVRAKPKPGHADTWKPDTWRKT